METDRRPLDHHLPRLLGQALGAAPGALSFTARPLRGGLVAQTYAVTAQTVGERPALLRCVAKVFDARGAREVEVYRRLVAPHLPAIAPRLLGAELAADGGALLVERVRRARGWPWRSLEHAAEVLRGVATLHAAPLDAASLPAWDYAGELARNAAELVHGIERTPRAALLPALRRSLPAVRRIGAAVRHVHAQLLAGPLPAACLHGDLHSGNVVVRPRRGRTAPRVALVDWQRARLGSPLEDVSSFLQSLAFWEPVVHARHDTLLGAYLEARGLDPRPTRALRDAYWLAGAANAFAGALAYHLAGSTDPGAPPATRGASARAAADWLRILRRADAVWSGRSATLP